MTHPVNRRTVLKGLGAAVALPWLEAMGPLVSAAPAVAKSPVRAAFLYVPNGMHMPDWTPKSEGLLGELPATLEPLKAFKNDINVLSGLALNKAEANGDGPGDHARARLRSSLAARHARPTGPTSGSANQRISGSHSTSATTPSSPHWNVASKAAGSPATATPVTAVPIRPTSPGATTTPRTPRRSTRSKSSSVSSAVAARRTRTARSATARPRASSTS